MLKINFTDLAELGLLKGTPIKLYIARGEGGSTKGPSITGNPDYLVDCIFDGTIYGREDYAQALYADNMQPVGMPLTAMDIVKANPEFVPAKLTAFLKVYEYFQANVDEERKHLAEFIEDDDESDCFFAEELTLEEEEVIAKRWFKEQPEHDYFVMQRFLLEFQDEYLKWKIGLNNEEKMQ